jgi:hypothetical protein
MTKIHPIISNGLFALAVGMASGGITTAWAQTPEEHAAHHAATEMGGGMGQMMPMMRQMMAQRGMPEACGLAAASHVEGRIAFLKTELAITDAQLPQWNAFADALRANARAVPDQHQAMMGNGGAGNLPDRLARLEKTLAARLEAAKAIEGPAKGLYGVLTEEQRKQADELMAGPMGAV